MNLKIFLKSQSSLKIYAYSTLCTFYFIVVYLIFSFSYPFAFIWPSNYLNFILSATIFPIYLSTELLYRRVIYPELDFIKSEKNKSRIIIILAIYIQINLIILTWSWSFFPSVLFMYTVFLVVTIQNTLIFEHTKSFSSTVLSAFEIVQLFFSAVLSNVIGVGAALQIVLQL